MQYCTRGCRHRDLAGPGRDAVRRVQPPTQWKAVRGSEGVRAVRHWDQAPAGSPRPRKVRVTIQTYRKRQADRDNEYTAWKPRIDALRLLGWIRDDSPKWIYEDIKDPLVDKTPRSEIVIEEVSLEI